MLTLRVFVANFAGQPETLCTFEEQECGFMPDNTLKESWNLVAADLDAPDNTFNSGKKCISSYVSK